MTNTNLDRRAANGKRLLGMCVAALTGMYLFALGFSWMVTKNIKMDGPAIAVGFILLMVARQGEQGVRIVLGCWVALLGAYQFFLVGEPMLRGQEPSMWGPFNLFIGCIYLGAAAVLLLSSDIRAYEAALKRKDDDDSGWESIPPEPPASQGSPAESFRPPSSQHTVRPSTSPDASAQTSPRSPASAAPRLAIPRACPRCGKLSPADADACTKCGRPFTTTSSRGRGVGAEA